MPLSARDPRPSRRRALPVTAALLALAVVASLAATVGPWLALAAGAAALVVAFGWGLSLLHSLGRYRTTTRSFFDAAGDAVLLLEPGTERVLDANRAACALYGYDRDEIVGMSARALSDDPTGGGAALDQLLEVGRTAQFDSTQRRRDGSPIRVRIRVTLARVHGRPVLVSVNRDVTDEEWFAGELARRTRELQAVADNARHLIVRFDADLRYRFVNRAVTELTGLPEEAFLGRTGAEVGLDARDVATWESPLRTALATGEPGEFEFEFEFTAADGPRTFVSYVTPERDDPDGPVTSLLCVSRDVTDERRTEAALEAAQAEVARFADVLGQTADGVVVTDAEGLAVWVNDGITRISGYAEDEILGHRPADLMGHQETDPAEVARVAAHVAAREPFTAELRNRHRDGHPYWVRISFTPLVEGGRFAGYVAIATDVTDQRETVAALRDSQDMLQATFENAAVGISHVGPDGRWLRVNGRLCEILGYTRDELLDLSFQDLTHPDDLDDSIDSLRQLIVGEIEDFQVEKRYIRKGGSVVWTHITASAVRKACGGVDHFITVVQDISKRKAAAAEAAASGARYQALVESIREAVVETDAEGRLTFANPAWQQITGASVEESLGRPISDFVHPDELGRHEELFASLVREEVPFVRFESRYLTASDEACPVEVHAQLRRGPSGAVLGMVGTVIDVTDAARFEAERAAREEAEKVLRLKSAFLANMSHEIRTPLTAILGFAEVLADEVPDDLRDFAVAVRTGGERLMDTLNAVLDLAQIEAGQMEPRPRPVDISVHLRATVRALRPLAEEKGLALDLDVPDTLGVSLDPGLLDRVVTNLLGNAVKFTERGGVGLGARHDGDRLLIVVADTGVGIAAGDVERLFEPFEQASDGHARTHEGNGLGLAIVRDVVALMGGEVGVESAPGEGSRFRVSLPAPAAPAPTAEPAAQAESPTGISTLE